MDAIPPCGVRRARATPAQGQPYNRIQVLTRPRTIVLMTIAAAVAVFLVVQDRVTASGARRYVALQRAAIAGHAPGVTIEEVMAPAIERSVQQGVLWGGVVLVAGLSVAAIMSRRSEAGRE